jgi:hypothetical protein
VPDAYGAPTCVETDTGAAAGTPFGWLSVKSPLTVTLTSCFCGAVEAAPFGIGRARAADSDEVARVKRDEAARDSWMMAPAVTE